MQFWYRFQIALFNFPYVERETSGNAQQSSFFLGKIAILTDNVGKNQ